MSANRRWSSGMLATEDWWSVWVGLALYAAGLAALGGASTSLAGCRVRGRGSGRTRSVRSRGRSGSRPAARPTPHGTRSLLGCSRMPCSRRCSRRRLLPEAQLRRFVLGFTVLYALTWLAWIAGNELHLTIVDAAVDGRNRYRDGGLSWGLQLGEGAPYLLALLIGLAIGNFAKGFAARLAEAAKPEWFIKTAIVFLGVNLGAQTIQASGFAVNLILTGAAATFVAYMFFWPIVYTLARRVFKLKRDASAVLASGISICGVSAAIATGGAIRARPVIPVTVSMLVVIFAMSRCIVLPAAYTALFPDAPIVNGAALGMTVKTDGADAAAGALLDDSCGPAISLLDGESRAAGWILSASLLTKIWIDVFIGVWAFVLAMIWVYKVEKRAGAVSISPVEIWFRFPKFVLGYFIAWLSYLAIAAAWPELKAGLAGATGVVSGPMRTMLFMLTFVAMGAVTDFAKLKGMGKLAVLYAIALVVVIAPLAYAVAYLFHRGLLPPPAQ